MVQGSGFRAQGSGLRGRGVGIVGVRSNTAKLVPVFHDPGRVEACGTFGIQRVGLRGWGVGYGVWV